MASIIDSISVKVTFYTEIHALDKKHVELFNTNDTEVKKSVLLSSKIRLLQNQHIDYLIQVGVEVVEIEVTDITGPAGIAIAIDYKVFAENGLDITTITIIVLKATEGIVNNKDKIIDLASEKALVTIEAIKENGIVIGR